MKTAIKLIFAGVVAALVALAPIAATAQSGSAYGKVYTPWNKQGKLASAITATTSSAATLLPTVGTAAWVCNTGSNDAYIDFGSSSVTTSTSTGSWVKAGTCGTYDLFPPGASARYGYIATRTGSSTTTLAVETGIGQGAQQSTSSGGGGGSGTSSNFGAAFPGAGTAAGFSDGTNMVPGRVEAAGADAVSNSTPWLVSGALAYLYNGTTWDRARGDATNGVYVQGKSSESHVGEVGSNIFPISNAMTTANATTTTGQSIGGLQTLANAVRVSGALGAGGTGGMIQSVMVTFKDAIGSGPLDVYYFNANPTGSTCTNNSAFVLADADRDKVIGIAHVSDFTSSNTSVVAQAQNQAMPFGVASSTSIYACVVARASFAITSTANASLITRVLRQ